MGDLTDIQVNCLQTATTTTSTTTVALTTTALLLQECTASATTRSGGNWARWPSAPAHKLNDNEFIFVTHVGQNVHMALVDRDLQSRGSRFSGDQTIDVWNQAQVVEAWNAGTDWYINYMGDLTDIRINCQQETTTTATLQPRTTTTTTRKTTTLFLEPTSTTTTTATTTTGTTGSRFRIFNKLSGRCVDVAGTMAPTEGSKLQLWDCIGGDVDYGQMFERTDVGMIRHVQSGYCIDVEGQPGVENNHAIMLWECDKPQWHNDSDHFWNLTAEGLLQNRISKKCLDVEGISGVANGHALRLYTCDNASGNPDSDQTWAFSNELRFVPPPIALTSAINFLLSQGHELTCNDIRDIAIEALANLTGADRSWISGAMDPETCEHLMSASSARQLLGSSPANVSAPAGSSQSSSTWLNISVTVKVMVPNEQQAENLALALSEVSLSPSGLGKIIASLLHEGLGKQLDLLRVSSVAGEELTRHQHHANNTRNTLLHSLNPTGAKGGSSVSSTEDNSSSSAQGFDWIFVGMPFLVIALCFASVACLFCCRRGHGKISRVANINHGVIPSPNHPPGSNLKGSKAVPEPEQLAHELDVLSEAEATWESARRRSTGDLLQ
jgi:hypothetical protein